MARIARTIIVGCPYNIIQRGSDRQKVFFTPQDYHCFLNILAQQGRLHGLEILGYCLMSSHMHLVALPRSKKALARCLGRTNQLYTRYVNRTRRRRGRLFQARPASCPLDQPNLWVALRYVERNPVRARIVRKPEKYPYSSAAVHCAGADPVGLLDLRLWRKQYGARAWRAELNKPEDPAALDLLRLRTRTGRPCGSDKFMLKLEKVLRRRLRPLPVGRPRKGTVKPSAQKWKLPAMKRRKKGRGR